MKNGFGNISEIPHNCSYCELRHKMCSYDLPELNEECEHFELGGCFTCKYGGCNGPIEENAVPGGICQSVLAFDFEKCKNYIQDNKESRGIDNVT